MIFFTAIEILTFGLLVIYSKGKPPNTTKVLICKYKIEGIVTLRTESKCWKLAAQIIVVRLQVCCCLSIQIIVSGSPLGAPDHLTGKGVCAQLASTYLAYVYLWD